MKRCYIRRQLGTNLDKLYMTGALWCRIYGKNVVEKKQRKLLNTISFEKSDFHDCELWLYKFLWLTFNTV